MAERKHYKVGDRVRIRDWDDMKREFGVDREGDIQAETWFRKKQKYLCGEKGTIIEIITHGRGLDRGFEVIIKFDKPDVKTDYYTLTDDMVELCSSFPIFDW